MGHMKLYGKNQLYRVNAEVCDDPEAQAVAGTEQYGFPLGYIDDRWRFTHFELAR